MLYCHIDNALVKLILSPFDRWENQGTQRSSNASSLSCQEERCSSLEPSRVSILLWNILEETEGDILLGVQGRWAQSCPESMREN